MNELPPVQVGIRNEFVDCHRIVWGWSLRPVNWSGLGMVLVAVERLTCGGRTSNSFCIGSFASQGGDFISQHRVLESLLRSQRKDGKCRLYFSLEQEVWEQILPSECLRAEKDLLKYLSCSYSSNISWTCLISTTPVCLVLLWGCCLPKQLAKKQDVLICCPDIFYDAQYEWCWNILCKISHKALPCM